MTISSLEIGGGALLIGPGSRALAIADGGSIGNAGLITLQAGGQLIVNAGDVTLSGDGRIELKNELNTIISGSGATPRRLFIEGQRIEGRGRVGNGQLAITNRGASSQIVANVAGSRLILDPGGGTVDSPGIFTNTDGAQFRAEGGGILELRAGLFVNFGGLILAGEGSTISLTRSADIFGGTIGAFGTGEIRVQFTSARLDSVELNGRLTIENGKTLRLRNTLTNNNTISLESTTSATKIIVQGPVTLNGTGRIVLADEGRQQINFETAGRLIHAGSHRIEGAGRLGEIGTLVLDNRSTIAATTNLQRLRLFIFGSDAALTNSGTLEAREGGILSIIGANRAVLNDGGEIAAASGSVVELRSVEIVGGFLGRTGGKGVLRAIDAVTLRDLTNRARFESLSNKPVFLVGEIENCGTAMLSLGPHDTPGRGTLFLRGGDVTLTGGGEVLFSDNDTNLLSQQDTNRVHTLINVDNKIRGAGKLGNNRIGIDNRSGGLIEANAPVNDLRIDPGSGAQIANAGTIQAVGEGSLCLLNGFYTNSALIRSSSL